MTAVLVAVAGVALLGGGLRWLSSSHDPVVSTVNEYLRSQGVDGQATACRKDERSEARGGYNGIPVYNCTGNSEVESRNLYAVDVTRDYVESNIYFP